MLNRFLYSFYGELSVVHRMNPVIKLLGLFVYVLICLLKYDNVLFICNISFVFVLMLLSNVNMFRYLKVIWKLKYILILMYVFMDHLEMELTSINIIVFKFVFFVLYLSMIVFTTTREDIGRGCSIVVNRFNIVGLSIKSISMFITNCFVFLDYFKESYEVIFITGEIKGTVYSHSNVLKKWKLIISNFKSVLNDTKDKMNNRKNDMKYRMYNERVKKKYKYRNKLYFFDYIYVILNIGMIVFYIMKVR